MKKLLLILPFALLGTYLLLTLGCVEETWDGHHGGPNFSAVRPECQVRWTGDTLPMWVDTLKDRTRPTPPPTVVPASGLSVPGPITDIPEFHDCQRFITPDGGAYEALYAIFVSPTIDATIGALNFLAVAAWHSSAPTQVSITSPGGFVEVDANATLGSTVSMGGVMADGNAINVAIEIVAGAALPGIDTVFVSVANSSVPAMHRGDRRQIIVTHGAPTASSNAVAEVYTYGKGYPALGIGPNFSCLYLYFNNNSTLVAKMVNAELANPGANMQAVDACNALTNPQNADGKLLEVRRSGGGASSDYPSVARWDYDTRNQQYHITLRCGNAFCDVGAPGPTGRPFSPGDPLTSAMSTDPGERRVTRIKGWYDRQEVAMFDAAGNPVPSGLVASVIPHPNLASYTKDIFANAPEPHAPWLPTGYVSLEKSRQVEGAASLYKTKYNYDLVAPTLPLEKLNKIFMCYGTRGHCEVPAATAGSACGRDYKINLWFIHLIPIKRMWVRLEAAGGGAPHFKCSTRRTHGAEAAQFIAPTARLRWLATDETVWEYCDRSGCCEVERDT